MNLIVAGGREYNDYETLEEEIDEFVGIQDDLRIISGMARGADMLGVRYARERVLPLIEMPADWNKHGKSAGYKRNEEMAKYGNSCICFWDGQSKGTGHMIDLARKYKLKLKIVRY